MRYKFPTAVTRNCCLVGYDTIQSGTRLYIDGSQSVLHRSQGIRNQFPGEPVDAFV